MLFCIIIIVTTAVAGAVPGSVTFPESMHEKNRIAPKPVLSHVALESSKQRSYTPGRAAGTDAEIPGYKDYGRTVAGMAAPGRRAQIHGDKERSGGKVAAMATAFEQRLEESRGAGMDAAMPKERQGYGSQPNGRKPVARLRNANFPRNSGSNAQLPRHSDYGSKAANTAAAPSDRLDQTSGAGTDAAVPKERQGYGSLPNGRKPPARLRPTGSSRNGGSGAQLHGHKDYGRKAANTAAAPGDRLEQNKKAGMDAAVPKERQGYGSQPNGRKPPARVRPTGSSWNDGSGAQLHGHKDYGRKAAKTAAAPRDRLEQNKGAGMDAAVPKERQGYGSQPNGRKPPARVRPTGSSRNGGSGAQLHGHQDYGRKAANTAAAPRDRLEQNKGAGMDAAVPKERQGYGSQPNGRKPLARVRPTGSSRNGGSGAQLHGHKDYGRKAANTAAAPRDRLEQNKGAGMDAAVPKERQGYGSQPNGRKPPARVRPTGSSRNGGSGAQLHGHKDYGRKAANTAAAPMDMLEQNKGAGMDAAVPKERQGYGSQPNGRKPPARERPTGSSRNGGSGAQLHGHKDYGRKAANTAAAPRDRLEQNKGAGMDAAVPIKERQDYGSQPNDHKPLGRLLPTDFFRNKKQDDRHDDWDYDTKDGESLDTMVKEMDVDDLVEYWHLVLKEMARNKLMMKKDIEDEYEYHAMLDVHLGLRFMLEREIKARLLEEVREELFPDEEGHVSGTVTKSERQHNSHSGRQHPRKPEGQKPGVIGKGYRTQMGSPMRDNSKERVGQQRSGFGGMRP